MLRRTLLSGPWALRKSSSALICAAGLGVVGCAGNHLDLSSRLPWSARDADSRVAEQRPAQAGADDDQDDSRGGRVFSAFVDRLPGRKPESRDPFLEQSVASASQRAAAANDLSSAPAARVRAPVRAAARTAPPVTQGRSDEELWRLFNEDTGTARVAAAAPERAAQQPVPSRSVSRPAVASRAPVPQQAQTSRSAAPQRQAARPATQSTLAQTAAAPAKQTPPPGTGPRPMPNLVAETTPSPVPPAQSSRPRTGSAAPQASGPVASQKEAMLRLEKLLAEVRNYQKQGALFDAYRTAIVAEQFAERSHLVFAPSQQQPAELVREIEAQMQASRAAALPEATAKAAAPAATARSVATREPQATSPAGAVAKRPRAADPFADDPATSVAQPWHGESVAQRPAGASESQEPFSTNFPPLHEWRGVRANSPVSLTVSSGRSPADGEASPPAFPVRQALATDEPTPGESRQAPLLARVEADRRQILERNQRTSLFGAAPQRGLARAANEHRQVEGPHTESPPPAESASRPEVAVAGPKLAKPASSRGSLVWWTLGLLALLTGGIALRSRSNAAHDD